MQINLDKLTLRRAELAEWRDNNLPARKAATDEYTAKYKQWKELPDGPEKTALRDRLDELQAWDAANSAEFHAADHAADVELRALTDAILQQSETSATQLRNRAAVAGKGLRDKALEDGMDI